MLDGGDAVEIHGVGFAGVKGFAGGFGRRALGPWGEETIKLFVREALDEALKLETALGKLRTERRVVLLHYSPIVGTVEGEPQEIYPYLGSSRLEEPLTRYPVDAVFHGHAHHGALEGKTEGGVPVYNVSLSLLQRSFPDRPPFRILELRESGGRTGRRAGSAPRIPACRSRVARQSTGEPEPPDAAFAGSSIGTLTRRRDPLPARHAELGHRAQIEHLLQLLPSSSSFFFTRAP